MPSTTGFLGLQQLQAGDALSYADYAFTHKNIAIIDRMLKKHEDALFDGSAPIADPTDPLSLSTSTTGGIIPAGRTVRYKFTWVDPYGNETAASPEASIATNAPIARPSQASIDHVDSGGSLIAGNYFYILSAYVGVNTSETQGGTSATRQITTGYSNTVTLTLPTLPAGADGFNIYRRGPGETQFYYLDTVDMQVATPPSTYVDDGSISINNSRSPSPTNLTYSTNSIEITVPDAEVPTGYTWKVYRTFVSANYDSSLLQWVVEDTGGGVINPTAVDYGSLTTVGSPPSQSTITSSASSVQTLSEIIDLLGAGFEGTYTDLAERLDDLPNIYSKSFNDVLTGDTTAVVDGVLESALLIEGMSAVKSYAVDAYIMFDTTTSEDIKLMFSTFTTQATPISSGTFKYTITNSGTAVLSDAGIIQENETEVEFIGQVDPVAVHIKGVFIPNGDAPGALSLSYANATNVATPTGAYLLVGSYITATELR